MNSAWPQKPFPELGTGMSCTGGLTHVSPDSGGPPGPVAGQGDAVTRAEAGANAIRQTVQSAAPTATVTRSLAICQAQSEIRTPVWCP
jgi:hypothetical protein